MTEDGSMLPTLEGSLQVFNLEPTKLSEFVTSSLPDPQLSPNGLFPVNHSSTGASGDLMGGMDGNIGSMAYSHLTFSPDLNLQHIRQDQKPNLGSNYYDNHFPSNVYNQPVHNLEPVQNIFKDSQSEKTGYVDMLNSSDGIMIKKEKLDFDDHFGNLLQSESTDMPYPPNTCVADWNYYQNTNSSPPSFMAPVNGYPNMHYQNSTGNLPNNLNHSHPGFGFSNLDLHNQAKKISQSIVDSTWSSENLYKSQVYNNMTNDSIVSGMARKRKPQTSNGTGSSKTRRRKTSSSSNSSLVGHSKTVASILLSEQNQPIYIGKDRQQNGIHDVNLLDSGARDEFVTSLMNNLRTTVQFESFCLSFPRNEKQEIAFQHKVGVTASLLSTIDDKRVCSAVFPEVYIRLAEKNIMTFKQALSKTERKTEAEDPNKLILSCNAEMVEEQMPHSMLWAVRLNSDLLTAKWEGQFVASVNPIDAILYFSIFQFSPALSSGAAKSLHQARMTKELAQEIIENMQQFEVTRQLRLDVDLNTVKQMYLHAPNGDENEGVLVLVFEKWPEYNQKWLHTSAEDKNKWQKRSSFFTENPYSTSASIYLYLGGLLSELNELVAQIFASIPKLKDVYQEGLYTEFRGQPHGLDELLQNDSVSRSAVSSSSDIRKSKNSPRKLRNTNVPLQKLRQEIIEVLVHFKISNRYELENHFDLDSITHEMCSDSLDIKIDEDVSLCFQDYINYRCNSARELAQFLEMQVMAWKFGFEESDYHPERLGDQDINLMTVAELIRTKCSDTVYYSFCRKEVGQLGHERHCSKCHQCTTWKYWHCKHCNKCSEGARICQFCGHSCDDPEKCVIKPLSVHKTELEAGSFLLDNIKSEWKKSLTQPDDDILKWNPPDVRSLNVDSGLVEYNTHNAMKDQLGLLNPVGFMFGQPEASRKHRRNKVRRQVSKPEPDSSSGVHTTQAESRCNIQ